MAQSSPLSGKGPSPFLVTVYVTPLGRAMGSAANAASGLAVTTAVKVVAAVAAKAVLRKSCLETACRDVLVVDAVDSDFLTAGAVVQAWVLLHAMPSKSVVER